MFARPPAGYPNQMQPLASQGDPRSQYLASALAGMRQQPQGSATGVGENLLAQALLQGAYSQNQAQNPNYGSNATTPNDGTGGLGGSVDPATGQPWAQQPQKAGGLSRLGALFGLGGGTP